jgi:hypothetical protein
MPEVRIAGGCQCGAVRYALHTEPTGTSICHCRMCQKAFGSFFAPFTGVPPEKFELTRGELSIFRSSDQTERGFCSRCGTPLTFHYVGRPRISVSIGSLDEPEKFRPTEQFGVESRMSWFAALPGLPGERSTEEDEPDLAARIARSNHQHPDHDTPSWPPAGGSHG